jgi:hypothetical protein
VNHIEPVITIMAQETRAQEMHKYREKNQWQRSDDRLHRTRNMDLAKSITYVIFGSSLIETGHTKPKRGS